MDRGGLRVALGKSASKAGKIFWHATHDPPVTFHGPAPSVGNVFPTHIRDHSHCDQLNPAQALKGVRGT
jgi:hypothetical protein